MKKILLIVIAFGMGTFSFAQTETSKSEATAETITKDEKKKDVYKLPKEMEYEIFDSEGKLIKSGTGTEVDYSKLDPGTYYIAYVGEVVQVKKEETLVTE